MNSTEIWTDELSDELLDEEIPCGGIGHPPIARSCSYAALLRSLGHGCTSHHMFKCLECWRIWYIAHLHILTRFSRIRCDQCLRTFRTVEAFSDYKPF